MKSKMKFEIAMACGMSRNTFGRWYAAHLKVITNLGVKPTQRLLPPCAVDYICHELGIHEDDFMVV